MTALTFTLKSNITSRLDCRRLTPDGLANLSMTQIENSNLFNTKNSPKIGDYFAVSGTDHNHIVFKSTDNQLDFIGYMMSQGSITIDGDCGDFLAANMRGGSIICKGNAGDRVGDRMRRGLVLIDGNTGDYCGSRMIAGTIGVYGGVGNYTGFSMKRGTILLKNQTLLHATLQDCGMHTLPFLALLFSSFKPFSTAFNQIRTHRVQRFAGDLSVNGNGEILVISP